MTDSPYELSTDVSMGSLYEITGKDSHRSLYVGVILQALLDLTKPKYDKEKTSVQVYRDQAHAWIFKTEGVTCEDFETVCTYAGVKPTAVRNFASNVINSGDIINVRRKFQSLL